MVHENFPAGVIVTNGLGSTYNEMIIAQFHLFLGGEVEIVIRPRRRPGGTGGDGTTFRPITHYPDRRDDDEEPWQPFEDEENEIIIKVRLGTREIQRHYFVRKRTTIVVTQVLHFVNTTRSHIGVAVGKITKTAKNIAVVLRNLGKKI